MIIYEDAFLSATQGTPPPPVWNTEQVPKSPVYTALPHESKQMPRMHHVTAVNRFIKASPWLTDEHLPAVTALQAMAESLDKWGVSPSLMNAYGATFRSLQSKAPTAEPEEDELEGLLKR